MAKEKDRKVTGVSVTVTFLPQTGVNAGTVGVINDTAEAGPCTMMVAYDSGAPDVKQFDTWAAAADWAQKVAWGNALDDIELRLVLSEDETVTVDARTPDERNSEHLGSIMTEVEKRLSRKGFEANGIKRVWCVHRPDPSGSYSMRGYFGAVDTIRLAGLGVGKIDELIRQSHEDVSSRSKYAPYKQATGGTRMATKKKAEEAKEKDIIKVHGKEIELSPKMREVYDTIVKRSGTGKPLGSDDARLSDPDSIAAMKLAREGAVIREKFGTRWHYFENEKDMKAAVAVAEKAAADSKGSKKATGKAASKAPAKKSGKKKEGQLKKPSEK